MQQTRAFQAYRAYLSDKIKFDLLVAFLWLCIKESSRTSVEKIRFYRSLDFTLRREQYNNIARLKCKQYIRFVYLTKKDKNCVSKHIFDVWLQFLSEPYKKPDLGWYLFYWICFKFELVIFRNSFFFNRFY